ncbi:MAG: serine dehydratase beta chain, partial [Mariniphaga sp.]|nr:serine dehydratase beta chain [Mariniphaga sp.]
MESIKEIYRIGHGPSSSHTMGPKKAAEKFLTKNKTATKFEVTLYGSLAATGKGHLTDKAIEETMGKSNVSILWKPDEFLSKHPNAMKFSAFSHQNKLMDEWVAYSIGGGAVTDDFTKTETSDIYPHRKMAEILDWCNRNGNQFWEYVFEFEP